MSIIQLTPETLASQHICCAISDKKCAHGYAAKKQWLCEQYANGYRFTRLDERGKVFIEYGPGQQTWMPIIAPDWMVMGCFWVSGHFKRQGYGKALLQRAIDDTEKAGLAGVVAVTGKKKMPFLSDGKWLLHQGFREIEMLESGFSLLALDIHPDKPSPRPQFSESARQGLPPDTTGLTVYYSNRCPFTKFHVETSLRETCKKRGLSAKIIKLATVEDAQNSPSPATIFSLFINDTFVTSDLSVCMDNRFDRIMEKAGITPPLPKG